MRVVISGAGAVGRHLAGDLAKRGHSVTLIEQNPDVVETAKEWAPDVDHQVGDACEPWVLEKVQMNTADVVVAATGDDEDNLVTSLLAKTEFAVPRVLARVNHPKNEWLFTEQWGVDLAVSPPHILTALVEEAVTSGDLVQLLRLEGGQVSIVEMKLALGDSLRRYRQKRQLTQLALAKRLGSSQSRVAKLEAGAPGISLDLLFRALFAAGVTTADIAREIRPKRRSAA